MSNVVTKKQLQLMIDFLNTKYNRPKTAYVRVNGEVVYQPGHFFLDMAYGGYKLSVMHKGGGEEGLSGYVTKRELYNFIRGFTQIAYEIEI